MTDPIKELIEGRHPEYQENLTHWKFLEDTYEGGREWFKGNIFQFVKEGDVEYEQRVARAYRFNHTKQIVDQVDKYLFKMPIARKDEDAPDGIKRFWERSTLSGLDMDTFAKRISNQTSIYGRIWVVVDSNVAAGEIKTLRDEKDANGRVYAYIVTPKDMLDMSYDEMGQLNWALVREWIRDDEDPFSSSRETRERFRLWTRTNWVLFEKQEKRGKTRYIQIDTQEHSVGVVPIVQADHVFSEELYEAPGLIDEIGYLDRAVANYLSNLDAIIQDQTFSQLAMPAQGLLPGEDGYDKLVSMSTKRVFLYNGESGAKPFYIAPDPKQAELILGAITKVIAEMYHSIGLKADDTAQGGTPAMDNASGVAKSIDFEQVNSLLSAKARSLQITERAILKLVCLYLSDTETDTDELLSYPLEFDVRSVYDEFEIAARLMLLSAPDEVRREQMRTVIEKLFPVASDKVEKIMEEALKAWPPKEIAQPGLAAPTPAVGKSSGAPVKAANTQQVAKELAT